MCSENEVKVAQLCLTLWGPMDYTVHGISRPEYWSGEPFPSPGIFPAQKLNWVLLHCRQILYQLSYQGSPYGVGSLSLLQGIFLAQESNLGLPHCMRILYWLSHKGSPRILRRVVYPFSSGSSWPRNRTGVSCIVGGFFTNWTIREAQELNKHSLLCIIVF